MLTDSNQSQPECDTSSGGSRSTKPISVVKRRRQFEIGFKRQMVQEVESGRLSLSDAARKYEISPMLISHGALDDKPSKKVRELEQELERYKVLLPEADADREFLKKAQNYAQRLRRQSYVN